MPGLERMPSAITTVVVKTCTRIGVVASLVYLVAGLLLLVLGQVHVHMYLMLFGVLMLFPHAVAVAYVASGAVRVSSFVVKLCLACMALSAPAYVLAVFMGLWLSVETAVLAVVGVTAVSSLTAFLASNRVDGGSVGLSLLLVSASYALAGGAALAWLSLGKPGGLVLLALVLTIAYPVTLIYAVTVHSLPATYRDKPSKLVALALPLLNALAAALLLRMEFRAGLAVTALGTLVYPYAARIYRVPRYLSQAMDRLKPGTAARLAQEYFLKGHYFAAASSILVAVYTALYAMGYCSLFCVLHTYTLGFITVHVLIHAPMMLPVILGTGHRRAYRLVPLALALVAAALWPMQSTIALLAYAAALYGAARIVA
ncbi:hypothetical protein [Hyperthermus butylicus]|uniref:Uncharacterized protein n=1 Tax=Hyperthermus butylicus (strain DSM 5456 / JCM 9403 / PLM1-5) TaxID=415426 RepID=A2BLP4_HYPBU|nr:hypothetical protein [Hyperthermus butylicus]ABM80905.1 hypothetical protein Hbut_1062 [Hyperthermus butylicus DSM 5456]